MAGNEYDDDGTVILREHPLPGLAEGLADLLEPAPSRVSTFYFNGWSGSDAWRVLTPQSWQTRAAAKKLARGPYKGLDFVNHHLVLAMPWGFFRVLDERGRTSIWTAPERPPI